MKLTNTMVVAAQPIDKPFKLSDGVGMYLQIMPNGGKYWRFKYRFAGKEKILAIGVYPDVSLKDARLKLAEARKLLTDSIDPGAVKRERKEEIMQKSENTFSSVSAEWYGKSSPLWSEKTQRLIYKRIQRDLLPQLGHRPISEITAPELLKTLRIIEKRSIEAAHRTLQLCSQIFRYAIATGKAGSDITLNLRGALSKVAGGHYAALSEKELPEFIGRLDNHKDIQIKLALKLLLLTFVRSIELRGAKWEEIDWTKAEWRIPAERMKMASLHIVPLSNQAIKVLRELQAHTGNREYILPSVKNPDTHISENILLHAIYDLGYKDKATIHGFRATASTILNENGFPADVIERQLAHTERNKVRASYNHAQHLPDRRKMLQWWGDYLDQVGGKNILPIRRAQ